MPRTEATVAPRTDLRAKFYSKVNETIVSITRIYSEGGGGGHTEVDSSH